MEFKVGDVVELKSGGPEMTIQGIGNDASLIALGSMTIRQTEKAFTSVV